MQIRVSVYKVSGRRNFRAEWTDPVTGKRRFRSTGTPVHRLALRFASKLEEELAANADRPSDIAWATFRERYEAEHVPAKNHSANTRRKTTVAFDAVEKHINPATVGRLRGPQLTELVNKLRAAKCEPATVAGYIAHIRAALAWAKSMGWIRDVPKVALPKGWKRAKGRAVSGEEFDRILDACRADRGEAAPSWERLLWGLWWSGLRINEAMHLSWSRDGLLRMDFSGKRPMFVIAASLGKNRSDQRFPMAPEFYEFVSGTPEADRHGYVFNPGRKPVAGNLGRMSTVRVSEFLAAFGKAANVKVADTAKGPRFASAHDLRRSFGFRWAKRVMPAVLQRMMRHSNISTTMEYYVAGGEDAMADAVWEAAPKPFNHTENHTLAESDAVSPIKGKGPRGMRVPLGPMGVWREADVGGWRPVSNRAGGVSHSEARCRQAGDLLPGSLTLRRGDMHVRCQSGGKIAIQPVGGVPARSQLPAVQVVADPPARAKSPQPVHLRHDRVVITATYQVASIARMTSSTSAMQVARQAVLHSIAGRTYSPRGSIPRRCDMEVE